MIIRFIRGGETCEVLPGSGSTDGSTIIKYNTYVRYNIKGMALSGKGEGYTVDKCFIDIISIVNGKLVTSAMGGYYLNSEGGAATINNDTICLLPFVPIELSIRRTHE